MTQIIQGGNVPYRDQFVTCGHCGKQFVFSIEDQRRQELLGFEIIRPELCADCCKKVPPQPGLRPGLIKWYQEEKGFGFLTQADGSEIFFHRSAVEEGLLPELKERTPVWYEIEITERGPQAINVHQRV